MPTNRDLYIDPDVLADFRKMYSTPDAKRAGLKYWLEAGVPEGCRLIDYYSQELIDEVQAEINEVKD